MTIYYYEKPDSHGQYNAESDDEALDLMPAFTLCLYRESDTKDGLPFVILYEKDLS